MRRLRSEAERGNLTCGTALALRAKFCRKSEILSHQWHISIAGGIYRLLHEQCASCRELNFIAAPIAICAASWNLRLPLAINFTWHEQAVLECGGNSNAVASKI